MKGKSKNRVRVEKGLFERRKAEKQRDEDRLALESGQKSREQLRQENGLFSGTGPDRTRPGEGPLVMPVGHACGPGWRRVTFRRSVLF